MALFENQLTEKQLRERVKANWALYRLVFSGFDYNTVFNHMTQNDIRLANKALDIKIEEEEKAIKAKKAK